MAVILDSLPAAPATATSLAPGFRFHPTDEELVWYYLRRKICRKPFRIDAISDVEVYKVEPWDLPDLSRIKTRDLEWYFFSVLDKKYGNGSRTNRATDKGYWKTTGKDRDVYHRSRLIGMKKTLVYHIGRAPKGERTNWVMHEYRLIDQDLERSGVVQDAFVLCRIFRKSGSGPKNGEQYGAPFVDEEWEDDELIMVPKQDPCRVLDDVDDAYLDADDLEQILGDDVSNGQPRDDQSGGPKLFDLPVRNELDPNLVKHEYISEPNDGEDIYVDYLLDQPYFDASSSEFQVNESSFLETKELNLEYTFDSLGNDEILENANEETRQLSEVCHEFFEGQKSNFASTSNQESPDLATMERIPETCEASQQLFEEQGNDGVLSLKQEDAELPTDFTYPFLHRGSCMLGNISSSSAFSSESSGKYLAAASQASTSIRVTTGMIRIRDVCFTGSKFDLSLTKNGHLSIVLSLQLEQSEGSFVNSHEDKHGFVLRSWLYCLLLWIVVLSLSFKIRSLFVPKLFMR